MAKIGLKNFLFGILTEQTDGTATYGAATKPAKAISCNVSISNNEATLYADDALAESDTSFQKGTVTLGIDDEDLTTMATLLGHQINDGNMVRNSSDTAPYVGLGRIITKMVGGVYKYKVEFLCKVKFAEPSQTDNTKGETLEFNTSEIEGTISSLASGDWSIAQTFDSMSAAQAYLNSLFGTSPQPVSTQYTITYDANGGTGTVAAVTVDAGESVTLSDGTGLTAPEGQEFAGWATTNEATEADVTSPYTPSADITLYAVWATINNDQT